MAQDSELLLDNLYNAFDPFQPLPAGDPFYVDCKEVRGNQDILTLGRKIKRSRRNTCQLYAGHRGAGKSTELLRLKDYLEKQQFYVVYFAADEEDIDSEDTQYTDILLACTRHLLEELRNADSIPLRNWLRDCWDDLKDLLGMKIELEKISIKTGQISSLFAKLTADLKAVPSQRRKIRERVNPHTVNLIKALNQFIDNAKKQLPDKKEKLAIIVDNLDRIAPITRENGRNNHDEIFLDRSEQLKGLNCYVVYTVPISMVYSNRANDIKDIYGIPQTLPMIMVRTQEGDIYEPGINKMKEIITERVKEYAPNFSLETEIFDNPETVEGLCLMSGGHVRNLMLLIQSAIDETEDLPISRRAVQIAITDARDVYRRTVESNQWEILAKVSCTKNIRNDYQHRSLLFNRCILEYTNFSDQEGQEGRQPWYNIHPLIEGITQFQNALETIT